MITASPADWPIKRLFYGVLTLTAALVLFIGLGLIGINVPLLRQIAGFLFLSLVPGVLILRILRVHNINAVESLGYSAGLSLAFVMFIGALLNFTLPLAGINSPLTLLPLSITFLLATIVLAVAAYLRDRDFQPQQAIKLPAVSDVLPVLFLALVLALTILGALLMYAFQYNLLLIICLFLISLVVILAAFGKFITLRHFPFAIFIISLCLLYQTTLISPYLIGTDIYIEYQFAQLALNHGIWAYAMPGTINSCLSIVIMAPVYSQILNLDIAHIFKILYPLFFSLVPLLLYRIFRLQIGPKKAFLAAFFFMAVPTFSLEMIGLARQQVAELFMALFILLLVERRLRFKPKLIMMVVFTLAMAVSHYALGFINFGYLSLMLVLVIIMRSNWFRKAWAWLTQRTGGLPEYIKEPGSGGLPLSILITPVILYFIIVITWYGLTASGSSLQFLAATLSSQFIDTVRAIYAFFGQAHLNVPTASVQSNALIQTALGLDFSQVSLPGKIFRILQYLTQIFIIVGCFRLLIKPSGLKFRIEYIALSLVSVAILAACIVLPDFAARLNATRWYHIALLTLAPFCILGAKALWDTAKFIWRRIRNRVVNLQYADSGTGFNAAVTLLILIPYFIFTSGIIYEITGQQDTEKIDVPYSIALSASRTDAARIFNAMDWRSSQWLYQQNANHLQIYTDYHALKMLFYVDFNVPANLVASDTELQIPSYVYLSTWNNKTGELTSIEPGKPGIRKHDNIKDISGLAGAIGRGDLVYANGGATVWFTE
jgi:uncharacterized membrane protein